MKPKKVIKECEKQLRKDPENLVVRLKLAAAYREVGRTGEAVELYRSVAVAYHGQSRLAQAIAVCKSVLEIDPSQPETQALLAELNRMRGAAVPPSAHQSRAEPPPSLPSLVRSPPPANAPAHSAGTGAAGTGPSHVAAASPSRAVAPGARRSRESVRRRLGESPAKHVARAAGDEWGKRSGMTPHRDSSPAAAGANANQSFRPRSTQPMDRPPEHRASVPLFTPTPLPFPLALHDVEDDDLDSADATDSRDSSAPLTLDGSDDALSAAYRIDPAPAPAPAPVPVPAPIAPPVSPPISAGGPQPLPPARSTMRGMSKLTQPPGVVEPLPAEAMFEDELPTRIAADVLGEFDPAGDEAMTRIADPGAVLAGTGQAVDSSLDMVEVLDDEDLLEELPPAPSSSSSSSSSRAPDEDELTRVASDDGRLDDGRFVRGEPAPPRPGARRPSAGIFSRDTRRILIESDVPTAGAQPDNLADALAVAADQDTADDLFGGSFDQHEQHDQHDQHDDDEPTADPARPRGLAVMDIEIVDHDGDPLPTPLPRHFAATEQDVDATAHIAVADEHEFPEEETDARADTAGPTVRGMLEEDDDEPTRPGESMPTLPRGVIPAPPAAPDDDEFELVRAFDRPFSETLQALDPTGAAIDAPLSIFSDLPDEALEEMARRMTLGSYKPGDIVVREGEPGDACFVIARGEVRVLKRDPVKPRGDLLEVARLGDGALFGEFALLADRRRHATVQAVQSAEIYKIPRRLLRELAATFPSVGPLLESFYRERLLATLLATAPFFKSLPEARRMSLLRRFRPQRSEAGQQVVVEGQQAGGLFLIVLGSVEITKRVSAKRSVLLATLGEGAYFGEMSLLKGGVANASVVAAGPTELAVMPPKDFYEIVAGNPQLWDEVRREANRRQLELNQIVTGETSVV